MSDTLKLLSVAIYSTSSYEKDIEETLAGGANIYITKPSSFKHLKKILKRVLEINRQYHSGKLDRNNYYFSVI